MRKFFTLKRISKWTDVLFVITIGSALQRAWAGTYDLLSVVVLVLLLGLFASHVSAIRKRSRANAGKVRGIAVDKRTVDQVVNLDRPAKNPKFTLSAQECLLIEKINNPENDRRFQDMIALWELLYGQPVDLTRPLIDIVAEASVALREKSS